MIVDQTAAAFFELLICDKETRARLEVLKNHGPNGAYLAAGAIRNLYWDSFYESIPEPMPSDTDAIYFDRTDLSKTSERQFEEKLRKVMPQEHWQVRNQARMHVKPGHQPYETISHALEQWPETATAIAVRLKDDGTLDYVAPFGLGDLLTHTLRITPVMNRENPDVFRRRVEEKEWLQRWPNIKLVGPSNN